MAGVWSIHGQNWSSDLHEDESHAKRVPSVIDPAKADGPEDYDGDDDDSVEPGAGSPATH
jgi:hypothetical protein